MTASLQIKNNRYYAVYYDPDRKQSVWRTLDLEVRRNNKREAQQRLRSFIRELNEHHIEEKKPVEKIEEMLPKQNKHIDNSSDILFADYIISWLQESEKCLDDLGIDIITYQGYESYAQSHIIPYFLDKKITLKQLTANDLEEYYEYKSQTGRLDGQPGGLSRSSVKKHATVISSVLDSARRENLIATNPAREAKIPKSNKSKKSAPNFYSAEQCMTLLKCLDGTWLHDIVYITILYGLRRSEVLGLKWESVSFDKETITIERTVVLHKTVEQKNKTKNSASNRVYPLLPEIKIMLLRIQKQQRENQRRLKDVYNDTGYVFTKQDGSIYYPSSLSHKLMRVIKENELPHLRFHDLRHSCASILYDRGWEEKDISEWLGHSDIETTMNIYAHIFFSRKQKMADSIHGLLG